MSWKSSEDSLKFMILVFCLRDPDDWVLLLFIMVGLPFVNLAHFQPFLTKGIGGVLSAAFLIFFAYAGFGKITAASEEVRNARKNVPRAIIVAVTICTMLYVLTGFVAVGVAGSGELSSTQYYAAPLSYVCFPQA